MSDLNRKQAAIKADIPSAEAVPVISYKWIEPEIINLLECSCCHARWETYDAKDFNYCPNCGAKME